MRRMERKQKEFQQRQYPQVNKGAVVREKPLGELQGEEGRVTPASKGLERMHSNQDHTQVPNTFHINKASLKIRLRLNHANVN